VQSSRLKILQVSDSHFSAEKGVQYRGQDADRNLDNLLPVMQAWGPDLVLLTGDVSEDASAAAYNRVSAALGGMGVPLLTLPGNHDEPQIMQHHFAQGPWNGPFVHQAGPWLLVLLDSTARGSISGRIQQQDLEALDAYLKASDADFVLVALHHQPVPVNAPWIDRFPLENPDELFSCLDRDARIRCVVWGHIHHDFHARRRGVELLGAPSAVANSLPQTPRFTLDPAGPACRWLELYADGRVETGLLRG